MNNQDLLLTRSAAIGGKPDLQQNPSDANEVDAPAPTIRETIRSRKDATETARVMVAAGWGLERVSAQTKLGLKRYLTIREYSKLSAITATLSNKLCDEGLAG
jgi:hypothetical protein